MYCVLLKLYVYDSTISSNLSLQKAGIVFIFISWCILWHIVLLNKYLMNETTDKLTENIQILMGRFSRNTIEIHNVLRNAMQIKASSYSAGTVIKMESLAIQIVA